MHDPIASRLRRAALDRETANRTAAAATRQGGRPARQTAPGSARALRLVPVMTRGVPGHIPGTRR